MFWLVQPGKKVKHFSLAHTLDVRVDSNTTTPIPGTAVDYQIIASAVKQEVLSTTTPRPCFPVRPHLDEWHTDKIGEEKENKSVLLLIILGCFSDTKMFLQLLLYRCRVCACMCGKCISPVSYTVLCTSNRT